MKRIQRVFRRFIVPFTAVLSGCTIHLGPLDESGETEPRKTSVLPAPEQPSGEEPVLDEAQQARKDEAERYVAEVVYQAYEPTCYSRSTMDEDASGNSAFLLGGPGGKNPDCQWPSP